MGEAYTIPAPREGATKSWRKTVTGVDPTKVKGFAVQGKFLDPGATYHLPPGGLIVGVDDVPVEGHIVTIWHAADDQLVEVKRLARKGPWAGPATIKAITKLFAEHPWPNDPATGGRAPLPPVLTSNAPNAAAGECRHCRQTVKTGEGTQGRNDRGYRYVEHRVCPPRPPVHNSYAGPCRRCGGWLDAGEGILISRKSESIRTITELPPSDVVISAWTAATNAEESGVVAVHEGDCPAPGDRKPAPARPNRYTEPCVLCWIPVPAGTGLYRDGAVVHDGACPSGFDGPTWTINYGRPGRYHPAPQRGYQDGQALRATLWEHTSIVPADAPGYRRDRSAVSAIVVVVGEAKPRYCRDEDGDQPADLLGVDGWFFQARVRVATAEEAAGVLTAEATVQQRDALMLRAELDMVRAGDQEHPDDTDGVLALPGVRIEPRRAGSLAFAASYGAFIHLRVDRAGGAVWVLRYNGADGDDWSANNCGAYVARRVPLTQQRAELVDQLASEFGEI